MKDYKICVYAICKNEEKFVECWYNSIKEADYIVVLDTGSTDKTIELLKEKPKIHVEQKIFNPFRFDVARNESMKLIPNDTDICICMDFDEIMQEGWVDLLKEKWNPNIDSIYYTIYWSFSQEGIPQITYKQKKIHKPNEYKWIHAAHEVLEYIGNHTENELYIPELIKEHHADLKKSRGNYLELLKMDMEERPQDDRARHYYARELMYWGKNEEAIKHFKIHLNLPNSTWEPERCASMRYIAKCSSDYKEKEKWLYHAIAEAPYLREPYIDMALIQYDLKNWFGIIYFCNKALEIKENLNIYTSSAEAWNETPYDLLSLAYWYIQNYEEGIYYVNKALEKNPHNKRIAKNKEIMENYYNSGDNK